MCPVCQAVLRPGELQEHMEQELTKLAQLQIRYHDPVTNDDRLVSQHSLYKTVNLFTSSLYNIMPSHDFITLHLLLLTILYFPPTFLFPHLSICHFLSVLFSFQVTINVDRFCSCRQTPPPPISVSPGGVSRLLCHLCAVFTSCLIVPYIFHITASGLKATNHTLGG